ncbi:MAG: hypothetical protein ABFD98_19215 [Syntrophobacteraceae bacterium]|nr:hypothetical protein [Desulfobacteraceae bacterium]
MSSMKEDKCALWGREVNATGMLCLAHACVSCEDGKWVETGKIWVL